MAIKKYRPYLSLAQLQRLQQVLSVHKARHIDEVIEIETLYSYISSYIRDIETEKIKVGYISTGRNTINKMLDGVPNKLPGNTTEEELKKLQESFFSNMPQFPNIKKD